MSKIDIIWEGVGTSLDSSVKSVDAALEQAGLNWSVDVVNTLNPRTRRKIPDLCVTIRDSDDDVFGLVSAKFIVVQNDKVFGWMDKLPVSFTAAGEIFGGRKVWTLARFGPYLDIAGDKVGQYFLCTNDHTGAGALNTRFVLINHTTQKVLNFGVGKQVIKQANRKDPVLHHIEAKRGLLQYSRRVQNIAADLSTRSFTERNVVMMLNKIYPLPHSPDVIENSAPGMERQNRLKANTRVQGNRDKILDLWRETDQKNQWDALMAFTEYSDWYRECKYEGRLNFPPDDYRFERVFYKEQKYKDDALSYLMNLNAKGALKAA